MDDGHSPKIEVIDLPYGEDAVFYCDLNIVGVSSRLPRHEWPRAIGALQAEWLGRMRPPLRSVS